MFNWICHNRDMFLVNYTEIGMSQKFAVELENEHSQFANSAVVRTLITFYCSSNNLKHTVFHSFHFTVWKILSKIYQIYQVFLLSSWIITTHKNVNFAAES